MIERNSGGAPYIYIYIPFCYPPDVYRLRPRGLALATTSQPRVVVPNGATSYPHLAEFDEDRWAAQGRSRPKLPSRGRECLLGGPPQMLSGIIWASAESAVPSGATPKSPAPQGTPTREAQLRTFLKLLVTSWNSLALPNTSARRALLGLSTLAGVRRWFLFIMILVCGRARSDKIGRDFDALAGRPGTTCAWWHFPALPGTSTPECTFATLRDFARHFPALRRNSASNQFVTGASQDVPFVCCLWCLLCPEEAENRLEIDHSFASDAGVSQRPSVQGAPPRKGRKAGNSALMCIAL